jgi:hypothetical protein
VSIAIQNTTPPISEGGSGIYPTTGFANSGDSKAIIFSTPIDRDSQIRSVTIALNDSDNPNTASYPRSHNVTLSLWSVGGGNGSYYLQEQIGPDFTQNVTLNQAAQTYTFTGLTSFLSSESTYGLLVSNANSTAPARPFRWGNTNIDLDTQPTGQNGFNYLSFIAYNTLTRRSGPFGPKYNYIILDVNLGPIKARGSLDPMPVGNINEHTGIKIATSGIFNGSGQFGIVSPQQSGNNDVKAGAYGSLVLNTQTGQYIYIPDFEKIEPLNSGETGIDEFKITLTPANGVISTGTYRVEIVGDGETTPKPETGKDILIGNFSRRTGSKPDVITNFNPDTDKLRLNYEYYGLSDDLRYRSTTQRAELRRYARRDVDLIALEEDDKIKLWWNQNGTRKGWGDGGMVALLEDYTISTNRSWPWSHEHDLFNRNNITGI